MISLKNAIEWLLIAWISIENDSISKCFSKSKIVNFNTPQVLLESQINDQEISNLQWSTHQIEEWSNWEHSYATDDPAVDSLRFTETLLEISGFNIDEVESDENEETPQIPFAEGVDILQRTVLFMEQYFSELQVSADLLFEMRFLKSSISRIITLKKIKALKQTEIDAFLK